METLISENILISLGWVKYTVTYSDMQGAEHSCDVLAPSVGDAIYTFDGVALGDLQSVFNNNTGVFEEL